jgi:hypothetical protein
MHAGWDLGRGWGWGEAVCANARSHVGLPSGKLAIWTAPPPVAPEELVTAAIEEYAPAPRHQRALEED